MSALQRIKAIDILLSETDVPEEEIEAHDDVALGAWMYELGYDWNGDAWVLADEDDEAQP